MVFPMINFPPCLFTNESPRIFVNDRIGVLSNPRKRNLSSLNELTQNDNNRTGNPLMTEVERRLWLHKTSSELAAQGHNSFPLYTNRFAGTITRTITTKSRSGVDDQLIEPFDYFLKNPYDWKNGLLPHETIKGKSLIPSHHKRPYISSTHTSFLVTKRNAIRDFKRELSRNRQDHAPKRNNLSEVKDKKETQEDYIEASAEKIKEAWEKILQENRKHQNPDKKTTSRRYTRKQEKENVIDAQKEEDSSTHGFSKVVTTNDLTGGNAGWDLNTGCLIPAGWIENSEDHDNIAFYMPPNILLQWIQKTFFSNQSNFMTASNDAVVELEDILKSCLDLCSPSELWRIPLIVAYPIVTKRHTANTSMHSLSVVEKTWTIQIGIYIHRLIFEATTLSLRKVMNALDDSSYSVISPVYRKPETKCPKVFESSPFPIVCLNDLELDENNLTIPPNTTSEYRTDYFFGMKDTLTREEARISAFTVPGLLKLLENHGTDITDWTSKIEPKIINIFQLDLMLHQRHAICWMIEMEQQLSLTKFGINSILWEEREFVDGGKYYYSPALGQLRLDPPAHNTVGGLLCDEMGLGKTVEVLGLIVATLDLLKEEAEKRSHSSSGVKDIKYKWTHTTLIIVPPTLVAQWQFEIIKATGTALTVDFIDFQSGLVSRRQSNMGTLVTSVKPINCDDDEDHQPDIVLTTYSALGHSKIPTKAKVKKYIESIRWGRVVLDEMQEIRSSTSQIARSCENLVCHRRWMLSGTPLFENDIEDLRGELNFLRLEPFAAHTEDGFFSFCISLPWSQHRIEAIDLLKALSKIMLRRSKSMTICNTNGMNILSSLPSMTVSFKPIPQTESERALYYFLEFVVSKELKLGFDCTSKSQQIQHVALNDSGEASDTSTNGNFHDDTDVDEKYENKSRNLCLRLLRQMCNSAFLLSGGLGVTSQLPILNSLLIHQMQRDPIAFKANIRKNDKAVSCDEAILYLAQFRESTRTEEGEISFLQLGCGQGITRRVRAHDTLDEKIQCVQQVLQKANVENRAARSSKAKVTWHLLLEKITTGRIPFCYLKSVSIKWRSLWQWRNVSISAFSKYNGSTLPMLLLRGWRPSAKLKSTLLMIHPNFTWAQQNCLMLTDIPSSVSCDDVQDSISQLWSSNDNYKRDRFEILSVKCLTKLGASQTTWNCLVRMASLAALNFVWQKSSTGFPLVTKNPVPLIDQKINEARQQHDEAVAAFTVHPTYTRKTHCENTKKTLEKLMLGLVISREQVPKSFGNITIAKADMSYRSQSLTTFLSLCNTCLLSRESYNETIKSTSDVINTQNRILSNLLETSKRCISESVQAMSTFESLEALSQNKGHLTQCPICLEQLGSGSRCTSISKPAISMTKCGHLYCSQCLFDYCDKKSASKCPTCRKGFHLCRDIIYIDPSKSDGMNTKQHEAAKSALKQASIMLKESNGLLPPYIWEQLYLSVYLSPVLDSSRDYRISAVPGDFLAHLRSCIGIPIMSLPKEHSACVDSQYLSSKVQALLQDLPRNELSVVFSSCKSMIQHLEFILSTLSIGCRSLYSGQNLASMESAITEWQSCLENNSQPSNTILTCPVLLVQAGAAASGLTLTASSKMFFMEPFLRLEEEQQAYARCHRLGQRKPVSVTVYYTPVSVESRLLEWRKRSVVSGSVQQTYLTLPHSCLTDTKSTYEATLHIGENSDKDLNIGHDQASFLLGLTQTSHTQAL